MNTLLRILLFASFLFLVACEKDKDIILDSEWIASSIRLENGAATTPDSEYTLAFENKGSYSLRLDVNLCGGEVSFRRKSVKFRNGMNCTEACCDSEFALSLASNLTKSKYWELNANQLVFTDDNGMEIIFVKK